MMQAHRVWKNAAPRCAHSNCEGTERCRRTLTLILRALCCVRSAPLSTWQDAPSRVWPPQGPSAPTCSCRAWTWAFSWPVVLVSLTLLAFSAPSRRSRLVFTWREGGRTSGRSSAGGCRCSSHHADTQASGTTGECEGTTSRRWESVYMWSLGTMDVWRRYQQLSGRHLWTQRVLETRVQMQV